MPGAVIAAQAVPEDCDGGPSGENFCRSTSALVNAWGWLTTVMSAPILVSQNDDSDCFTDTSAAPFALLVDFHEVSEPPEAFGWRAFAAGPSSSVAVSVLSWLQSGSGYSLSASLVSEAAVSAAAS